MKLIGIVDRFFASLRWVLERKDMDSFWPVGLSSTASCYGRYLIEDLESAFDRPAGRVHGQWADFPTSSLVVALAAAYGGIQAEWNRERMISLLEKLLSAGAQCKHGDLLNVSGANRIYSNEEAACKIQKANWCRPLEPKLLNTLSAIILAFAESLFFCNHRICTEKHGPYRIPDFPDRVLLVRSVKNLKPPSEIWSELQSEEMFSLLPDTLDLFFVVRPHEVKFDLFSNIIHSGDTNANLIDGAMAWEPKTLLGDGAISDLTTNLSSLIPVMTAVVAKKTHSQLREQFAAILYFACRGIFDASGWKWQQLWTTAKMKADLQACRPNVPIGTGLLKYWGFDTINTNNQLENFYD